MILNGVFRKKQNFNPASDITGANLVLWQHSENGITTVSGDVSEWSDIQGNYNATQSTAASRPTLETNIINGRPTVRNPDTKILTYGNQAALELDDLSIFAVVKKTTAAVQSIISIQCQAAIADTEECGLSLRFTATNTLQLVNFSSIANRSAVSATGFTNINHVIGITKSGTTCRFFNQNGNAAPGSNNLLASLNYTTTQSKETALFAQPTDVIATGEGYNSNFAGDVGEVLVYDGGLSTPEGEQVASYLTNKWNI